MHAFCKFASVMLLLAACGESAAPQPNRAMTGQAEQPQSGAAGSAGSLARAGASGRPESGPSSSPRADAAVGADAMGAAGMAASAEPDDAADGGTLDDLDASRDSDAQTSQPSCVDCCRDGFARGKLGMDARKLLGMTPSPEGVSVCPNGEVFIAADDGQIWRVPLDGAAPERWSALKDRQPAGLACDEKGRLFVAIYSIRSGSGTPGVMRIDGKDLPAVALPGPSEKPLLSAFNGIIAIPGLGVYASDSGAGSVIRWRETSPDTFAADVVATDIPIANGLAYDPASHTMYVASSLGMAVLSFSVAADGSLSDQKQVMTKTSTFFDGVAVDENGVVYAADYNGGAVLRLADSMTVAKIANPASFAFRGGTLLVTDYKLNEPDVEGGLYAIDLGVCGALTFSR